MLTSEAVGLLVAVSNTLAERGGQLHVAGLSDRTRDVLEITNLQGVIRIFDTTRDAAEKGDRPHIVKLRRRPS